MQRHQKAAFTRALNRFEQAVDDKAFEGTVPYDSEAAILEHERIDREYAASRAALYRMMEKLI